MNEKTNQKISEALGLEPLDLIKKPKEEAAPLPVPVEPQTKLEIIRDKPLDEIIIDEDFNEARENMKDILEKHMDAASSLSLIAQESEKARDYEVLAAILKNAADINEKLLLLSKTRKELTKGLPQPQKPQGAVIEHKNTIQNAVFVGTTDDLDDMLEKQREAKLLAEKDVTPKQQS